MLSTLAGLGALRSTGGLAIDENPRLMSLEGLDALATVDGHVHVSGSLPSLAGLGALVTVGGLTVDGARLTTLAGLDGLTTIAGSLRVWASRLTSIAAMARVTRIDGNVELGHNECFPPPRPRPAEEGRCGGSGPGQGSAACHEGGHLVERACEALRAGGGPRGGARAARAFRPREERMSPVGQCFAG